ncbi:molybdenum cofactor biosysynthesis protein [Streptomyces longisporoflavus]|uniref:MOSC domain-containing protein n=1 Tax=Streptomyces longisporoflavus TaxID=28044 RepID=UPI0019AB23F3|nr:MOSC N-terminal beta barrel domain-containing protein [Streptomyces longisporoflavus]GGV52657.1 molybdenum cofactor biosysynthesis protein [Streptomyces longisporoflavus]
MGLVRFPVKSMLGEERERLVVDGRGVAGDRLWALRHEDGKLGSGKNSRRFRHTPGMLEYSAVYEDGGPVVTTPDGETLRPGDPRVPELFGAGVALAREDGVSHQDAGAVSLVGTASLRAFGELLGDSEPVDVRRLRKNIVLGTDEPWIEEDWVGREIAFDGGLRLRVTKRIERCVMTTQAQRGLPADNRVLKTLTATRGMCIGVYADVVTPGTLALGERVSVE